MVKQLFEHEVDFSLCNETYNFKNLGDIDITTRVYNGVIWAKFERYTPYSNVEFTIEEDLNSIRCQYLMFDALVRATKSYKS